MSPSPQRAGWWRFPAPSVLAFALLMGVFPWIEVGCEGKPKDFEALNQPNPMTGKRPSRPVGQNGTVVLATQNGYQAIWGGASPGPEIREIQKEAEQQAQEWAKQMAPLVPKGAQQPKKPPKNPDEPDAAPLLGAYFFFLVVAVTVGFVMSPGLWRSLAFLGTAGLVVLLFGIQAAVGLPLKRQSDAKGAGNLNVQGADGFNMQVPNVGGPQPYCRYTPWYYLNWPFLLLPLGLVGVEEVIGLLSGVGRPRRRRRYDDEDDDRPRRRRRYDDEDDEDDDRPRRRSRGRDEGNEDEPPRRRRRYDDEDDERHRRRGRWE
jgi:hypothetical protein